VFPYQPPIRRWIRYQPRNTCGYNFYVGHFRQALTKSQLNPSGQALLVKVFCFHCCRSADRPNCVFFQENLHWASILHVLFNPCRYSAVRPRQKMSWLFPLDVMLFRTFLLRAIDWNWFLRTHIEFPYFIADDAIDACRMIEHDFDCTIPFSFLQKNHKSS